MTGPRTTRAGPRPHHRPARRSRAPALVARARGVAAAVLLGISCALVPVAVFASWAGQVTFDTDRYVATVAPLARDRVVQDAVVRRVARALEERAGDGELTGDLARWLRAQGLPPRTAETVRSLGPHFGSAFDESVLRVVDHVVRSDQFATAWADANRTAHRTFLRVLAGEGHGAVEVADGAVTLDLGKLLRLLRRELAEAGLPQAADVPAIDREVVLVRPGRLGTIETAARLLDLGHPWLHVLTVALGTAGLTLARDGRAVARAALGTVLSCLLFAAAVLALRERFLGRWPESVLPRTAAAAVFDTSVRALRDALGMVLMLGAATAAGAGLAAPGRVPGLVRAALGRAAGACAGRIAARAPATGRYGAWAADHHGGLVQGAVLTAVVLLGAWDRPTPRVVLYLLLALAVTLSAIALLTALGRVADPGGPARPGEPAARHGLPAGCGDGAAPAGRPAPAPPPPRLTLP